MAEDPKNPFGGMLGGRRPPKPDQPGGGAIDFRTHPIAKQRRVEARARAKETQEAAEARAMHAHLNAKKARLDKEMDRAGMGPRGSESLRDKHYGRSGDYIFTRKAGNVRKGSLPMAATVSSAKTRQMKGLMGPRDLYIKKRPPPGNDN